MTPSVSSGPRARTRGPLATAVPLVLFSLVALQGCDVVTADLKHSETAEWRKTYELSPGGRVDISNVNGRIEVEPSAGNTVEVVAQKVAKGATPAAAKEALERIEIREEVSSSGISIATKLPRGGGWFDMGNAQVKYSVRVPAGAEVKFTTVNGGVSVTGLSGRVTAETTNGGVVARDVSGTIDASTTNGGVDVELARLGEGGAKLACTNGGIRLRLPADAKASISASVTNGGIDTSGLAIETTQSSRRRLEGRLNGGGAPIQIEGTNGGIRIGPR
jgi:Putative adhesin